MESNILLTRFPQFISGNHNYGVAVLNVRKVFFLCNWLRIQLGVNRGSFKVKRTKDFESNRRILSIPIKEFDCNFVTNLRIVW